MSGQPNYGAQGFKDILVTLREPGVAVVIINRAKQSVYKMHAVSAHVLTS
jgi:hypothetical protein